MQNYSSMFGVSTFCLHQEPLAAALDAISSITDCVEVMDEGPHLLHSSEVLENYAFRYFIHAPSRGVNISSLLEPIRRASLEVTEQCFAIAAEVGAGVVVHPGYFAWRSEREQAEALFSRSLEALHRAAEEHSITFFIENMGNWDYFLLKTPDELRLLGDAGFALDVGHAHQNACLAEFLSAPAKHFHIHDNDGKADSHLPVGQGTIDFGPVMESVQRNGATPIVEVATFDGAVASIERLKRLL